MSNKVSSIILPAIILSVILGGVFGYLLPDFMLSISFIGLLFLNALKIIIIPLIVVSLIVGVAAMGDPGKISRTTGKTVLYFLATSGVAIGIGLILVYLIQPGANAGLQTPPTMSDIPTFGTFDAITSRLVDIAGGGRLLILVVLSVLAGTALAVMGTKAKNLVEFFKSANDALGLIVQYLLYAAPLGIFCLVGAIFAQNLPTADNLLGSLGAYSLTLGIAFLIQALVVLPLAIKLLGFRSPWGYFKRMLPAVSTALGTSSSASTLPVTYDCVVAKNQVDQRAGAFALTFGSIINTSGGALYLTVAAIFMAQLFGISLSIVQVLIIVVASLFASIGSSVMPYASMAMLAVVLNAAGLPNGVLAAIPLLLAVDWFFDPIKTAVNVLGDGVGAAVVGETFEFKTARRAAAPSTRQRMPAKRRTERQPRTTRKAEERKPRTTERRTKETPTRETRRERPARSSARTTRTGDTEKSRGPRSIYQRPKESTPSPFEISGKSMPALESGETPDLKTDTTRTPKPRPSRSRTRETGRGPRSSTPKPEARKTAPVKDEPKKAEPPRERPKPAVAPKTEKPKANTPAADKAPIAPPDEVPISDEMVEREKAKMAAILESMKAKERQFRQSIQEAVEQKNAIVPDTEPETGSEKTESDYPKIDFLSAAEEDTKAETVPSEPTPEPIPAETAPTEAADEPVKETPEPEPVPAPAEAVEKTEEPVPAEPVATEPATTEPESTATEEETAEVSSTNDAATAPISFGRTHARRGAAFKKNGTEAKQTTPTDESPEPKYSKEKISFGRSKRKR